MPNYVMNNVQFSGPEKSIKKLYKLVYSEENEFDFNKIIPMPEELNLSAGLDEIISIAVAQARRNGETTCSELSNNIFAMKEKTFDEWADLGERYLSNEELYGSKTWYDWHCNKWGTKWNSCDAYWTSDDSVSFETAWSTPEPIFMKLSELFPDVNFDVEFADEDYGYNCGTITYQDGSFNIDYNDDFDFACRVWGENPDEIRTEYYEEEEMTEEH